MAPNTTRKAKVEQRPDSFDEPHQVVVNPALSQDQKIEVLDGLEQDARQLSVASAEGMIGGEPSDLQEVLDARNSLKPSPTAGADPAGADPAGADNVAQGELRSRQKADEGGPAPKPNSRSEIEDAAILEQLGP